MQRASRTVSHRWWIRGAAGCCLVLAAGCSNPEDPSSTSSGSTSAPASHTVSKHGVMHMTGLTSPGANCSSCHGSDLRGGTAGTSCYKCHGQLW